MSMKQGIPTKVTVLFCFVILGLSMTVSAAGKDKESAGHEPRGQTDDSGVQIIIRSDAEKKHRQRGDNDNQANNRPANDNSNRQSDANSERGLDRAEERRSDQADKHSQAGEHSSNRDERSWYDPFGIFDKDKDKADKHDEKNSWWWPFD